VVIEFIGAVHDQFKDYVCASPELSSVVQFTGNIPHNQLIARYGESSLLLLILTGYKDAEGFLPGKLFDYLATGLPVLGVGPVDGDAGRLLQETQAGKMLDSFDLEGIKRTLLASFGDWQRTDTPLVKKLGAERFSRKATTSELINLL
jgi:glycosyltransferase involved in cell wall biosynthesis